MEETVLNFFKVNQSQKKGMKYTSLCRALPDLSLQNAIKIVTKLEEEGWLYKTIDNFHFRYTLAEGVHGLEEEDELTPFEIQVLECFKLRKTEEKGVSLQQLQTSLRQQACHVQEAVKVLHKRGYIFQTVEPSHFCYTSV
jgi:hypothetical protein